MCLWHQTTIAHSRYAAALNQCGLSINKSVLIQPCKIKKHRTCGVLYWLVKPGIAGTTCLKWQNLVTISFQLFRLLTPSVMMPPVVFLRFSFRAVMIVVRRCRYHNNGAGWAGWCIHPYWPAVYPPCVAGWHWGVNNDDIRTGRWRICIAGGCATGKGCR